MLKKALADITAPIAAAAIAYASQTNNNELLDAVNFSQSELLATRDDLLGDRCQNIHTKANDNIAALAAYGITALMLTDMQNAITAYLAKVPAPSTAKLTKKTATLNLSNLFKATDVILKMQLDKLMLQFKTSHPDFYNNYVAARVIIDLGATHTRMAIFVKEQGNSALAGVTAALMQNNLVVYSLTSAADGKIALKKIKPGTYTLKLVKPGFVTKEEEGIQFKAGKEVKRTVTLLPGTSNGSGGTAIREGDVAAGAIAQIEMETLIGTPSTFVNIETTETFRVYASATADGLPDTVFFDVSAGTPVTKTSTQIIAETGLSDTKTFLLVQNTGAADGHYKFTFHNLEQ